MELEALTHQTHINDTHHIEVTACKGESNHRSNLLALFLSL